MNPGPLLLVPRTGKGRGGGHLVRCTALVRELRSLGREAWLYLPGFTGDTRAFGGDSPDGAGFDPGRIMTGEGELRGRPWDWIILDYFRTPRKLFEELAALAPLIAIDEGGPCRGRCDFTLDLLPGLSDSPGKGANYFLPGLLPLPKNRRPSFYPASPDRPPRVLVSFGAEDPRKLTVPLALALRGQTPEGQTPEISVLFGPLYDRGNPSRTAEDRRVLEGAGIRVLGEVPLLREHLAEYDLVITHFGLTAFEALHARTAVLLLAPGGCHEKLAVRAGFPSAGIGRRGIGRLRRMLGVKAPSKTGKADPLSPPGLAELRRRCE
ncbi:MAG: hypothetical protein LBQ38_09995, partial [Spirochaetaceae bacterium]|nr:hypothetical protein [Spirochaetaceae bacterium]